jgi:dienelactone hydrolase
VTVLAALLALAVAPEVVTDWLVIAPTDKVGRRPFSPSAVFARHLLAPGSPAPMAGDVLKGELVKELAWEAKKAGEDGSLGGEVGWAYATVEAKSARVVLAKLSGASRLFVNGTGYVGDAYAYGFGGVPVALREGRNDVYVGGVRGSFRLELSDVDGPLLRASWDDTIPDMAPPEPNRYHAELPRESRRVPCGILVWNATATRFDLEWKPGPDRETAHGTLAPLAPCKLGVSSSPLSLALEAPVPEKVGVTLRVRGEGRTALGEYGFDVPVRQPGEARRVGFVSAVDGSVQWCAYVPSQVPDAPRVVLSLHGAGVDALGQARSYAPKSNFELVCPTNRRPYGFDWQDWGRRDAYEALQAVGRADPRSGLCLTGHSMGGHGTWSLAANDPDRFLAIAPSAGWCSFDTYGGRPDGELKEIWQRADGTSRTLDLVSNLAPIPTYVLHGTADDNVPASEAHDMIAALEKAGGKPQSHFQEGAGHWWDGDRSPGADCVDWPEIFQMFERAERGNREREFEWASVDPGVDSRNFWVEVLQPLQYGLPFRVTSRIVGEDADRRLALTTENVRRLRIHVPPQDLPATVDGRPVRGERPVELALTSAGWNPAPPAGPAEKSPERCGPFKRAFDRRFVLVHGTKGDDAEDRELFERARHDLCVWWYRANGTPDLLSDVEALAADLRGRNVILYGNADTNAAWKQYVGSSCPLVAQRGALKLGERTWKGDDLAAVLVFPRADDDAALVGAFADTGVRGSRLGYTLAPFTSGVGYPDYAVFSSRTLTDGDGGVLAAGWFDHRWQLDPRAFVRAEPK